MGDAVKSKLRASSAGAGLAAALAAAVLLSSCASATPEVAGAAAPAEAVASAPAPRLEPVEISGLDVMEGAPGARIEISASAPLVWTTYRDADGNLVVELPNSRPASGLADQTLDSGLVSTVRLSLQGSGERPLTRMVVATREDAELALAAVGNRLLVDLAPVADADAPAEPMVAAAPAPAAAAVLPATPEPVALAAAESAPPQLLGTAERPIVAAAPTGAPATFLEGIEVVADGPAPVVRVAGDGEFAYSTFRLENPDRFVIDLDGVTNVASRGVWNLSGEALARVRVSQFKGEPQPVSRVVFDLAAAVEPAIERSAEGLLVRFGGTGTPTTLAQDLAPPAAEPAPVPVSERVEPAPEVEASAAQLETAGEPAPREPTATETAIVAQVDPAAFEATDSAPSTAPAYETAASAVDTVYAETPAPAAPAPPTLADFEAADMQTPVGEATPARPMAPTAGESQTVGGGKKQYVGEPISLSLKDADVKDVLRSFAKISGLNVVVQPGVRGTVTVELESVPWDQALDQILKINGLGYELEGNIMRIAPTRILEEEARRNQALAQAQALSVPLRTVVKRLSYSTASQMSRILMSGGRSGGGLLSQRGTVTIDARTNTLIIKELPTFIDTVIAVIETLDIPEPQVMIEARIVETTKRFSRSLGIAWGFDGVADAAHGNTTGLVFPNNVEGSGGVSLLTGGANGFIDLALGNVLNTFNLDMRLQAAESEGLINVLSAPKIATLNNEPATIQSGLQIPIQTVANNTVSVQFVNATLRLQVTPHVTAEGTVLLDINIQKREPQLAFAVVGATNAPIATKEAQTRVIVRDGGTTVIGGIYEVSTDQGQDRVPGLSNVPLLGHLFKNKRRLDENEELLIFITPRVIKL